MARYASDYQSGLNISKTDVAIGSFVPEAYIPGVVRVTRGKNPLNFYFDRKLKTLTTLALIPINEKVYFRFSKVTL